MVYCPTLSVASPLVLNLLGVAALEGQHRTNICNEVPLSLNSWSGRTLAPSLAGH